MENPENFVSFFHPVRNYQIKQEEIEPLIQSIELLATLKRNKMKETDVYVL